MSYLTPLQKAARETVEKAHQDLQTLVRKFAVEHNLLPYQAEQRLDVIAPPDYVAAKKRFTEAYQKRMDADRAADRGV